jgi:hypothetical protein
MLGVRQGAFLSAVVVASSFADACATPSEEAVDGSLKPWEKTVPPDEIIPSVERFLTKRARWFVTSSNT